MEDVEFSRETFVLGRRKEINQLQEVYQRTQSRETRSSGLSEVVLISCDDAESSSTCSNTVVPHALHEHFEQEGSIIGYGRFPEEEKAIRQPFSAIVMAINGAVEMMQKLPPGDSQTEALARALGSDGVHVAALIPSLRSLLPKSSDVASIRPYQMQEAVRLQNSLRTLVRTMGQLQNVVLVLEGFDHADEASQDVLNGFITDLRSKHVLFVLLSKAVAGKLCAPSMLVGEAGQILPLTKIHYESHDVEATTKLCSEMLCLETSEVQPLAEVLHRWTIATRSSIGDQLQLIRSKGFLRFIQASGKWEWDFDQIMKEEEASCSSSQTNFLGAATVDTIDATILSLLEIASCLGVAFHHDTLLFIIRRVCLQVGDGRVLSSTSSSSWTTSSLTMALNNCCKAPLVVLRRLPGSWYMFTCEPTRQFFYKRIQERRGHIHESIGRSILDVLGDDGMEDNDLLLLAVEMLNVGLSPPTGKTVEHIRLNYIAARLAVKKRAFNCASWYLEVAKRYATSETDVNSLWQVEYELMMNLHRLSVLVSFACKKDTAAKKMSIEPISRAKSNLDKIDIYLLEIEYQSVSGNKNEALEKALSVMELLDEKLSRKVGKGLLDSVQNKKVKKISDVAVLGLPCMEDPEKLACMKLLSWIVALAYDVNSHDILNAASMKMIKLTTKHGLAPESALAYASYAVTSSFSGNLKESYRFGSLSMQLLERLKVQGIEARLLTLTAKHVLHWQEPLFGTVQPLSRAIQAGLRSGDMDWAYRGALELMRVSFCCGRQLFEVEEEMRHFCRQMAEMGHSAIRDLALPFWQGVLNLTRRSEDPSKLSGHAMKQSSMMKLASSENNKEMLYSIGFVRVILAAYYQNWSAAESIIEALDTDEKTNESSWTSYYMRFFSGLIHMALSRISDNSRKYKAKAKQDIQKLKKIVANGNQHCNPMLLLLEAEFASLAAAKKGLKPIYDKAISAVVGSECVNLRALANERAGLIFLDYDDYLTNQYMEQALEYYFQWGAIGIVERLERKFHSLQSKPKVVMSHSSGGSRGTRETSRSKGSGRSKGSKYSSKSNKSKHTRVSRVVSDE